ncbi:OTU domain-containing protein [Balamuthia mandrillaris]
MDQPLSLILFEHTRGTTKKELTSSTLPNWPALRNCFYALRNIEKRLKDEETKKRFCKEELRFQQRKLQLAAIILFNNPEVRLSKQVPAKLPEIEADLYPFLASPPEKKLLVGFITPIEFVMDTFRSLIAEQTVHKILSVEGDGNCFFRAVIKFMYPEIPRDWEDVLSLKLRKKINTGTEQKLKKNGMAEEYPYQGFVIQDVNDSITMAKAGVWADHIQVQKLSNLLERPIQVVAFDDLSLRLTYNRTLAPGRDLIIGSQFASEGNGDKQQRSSQRGLPILLYFTPTPGHYEALSLPSDKDAPANLIDTFDQLSQRVSLYLDGALDMIPSFSLVSFYFKLETNGMFFSCVVALLSFCSEWLLHTNNSTVKGNLVQEIYSRLSNRESREIKQAIEVELNERVSKQLTLISRFKALLDELGKPYLEKLAKLPEWHIDGEVLSTLLADALAFGPERELLVRGSGPLSQLTERALACCPPSFSLESSCPSSSEIFNAPQRHSPRMGEEKGKSESPATPQGDINNTKQGERPTAEKMLSQDSTGEAEWVAFLRRAAEPDGGANLVAKGGRASARSLSNLLSALETLYKRHDVKITDLHLWNLSLDKEACEVLAPPEGLPYWLKSLQLHACSLALPPNSLQSSHPKLSLFNCS